jgi:hypothetical protein
MDRAAASRRRREDEPGVMPRQRMDGATAAHRWREEDRCASPDGGWGWSHLTGRRTGAGHTSSVEDVLGDRGGMACGCEMKRDVRRFHSIPRGKGPNRRRGCG